MTRDEREQRLDALQRGNEVRFHRARLKRKLAAGETTVAEVLRSDDSRLATMLLCDLLRAAPGLGATKTARALSAQRPYPLSPSMTVARLTPKRREELLIWLATNHPAKRGQFE